MNSNEIIRVENLTYRYRNGIFAKNSGNVINNASFSIKQGFVYGMAGKNGAGKTTLLRLLSGEITKYQGSIEMADVSDFNEYKNNIGVISEAAEYIPHLSVSENATILGGLYKNFDMGKFKEYIRQYEIDEYTMLSSLSAGERIKFCIAFSMAYEPQVLIMDEPAGVLDITSREELISLIRLLVTEKNKTVIIATHLTDDLDSVADYIMFVNDDGKVSVCDRESLNDRYMLLKGSKTQMAKIPSDKLLAVEKTETSVTAMTDSFDDIRAVAEGNDIITETPDIEEIMYFKDKADKKREKAVKSEKGEYLPKNRGNEGSDYERYLRAYDKMVWCSKIKWGQRITGFLFLMNWSVMIATKTDWDNVWQQLILMVLVFASLSMFVGSFETPKNMDFMKLFSAFATSPVSKKDVYRKVLVQRGKGIAIGIVSQVAVIMLFSGERIEENIESVIFMYVGAGIVAAAEIVIEWWKINENADIKGFAD